MTSGVFLVSKTAESLCEFCLGLLVDQLKQLSQKSSGLYILHLRPGQNIKVAKEGRRRLRRPSQLLALSGM
jgi:hypothetical protein